jgi:hypothetical protein
MVHDISRGLPFPPDTIDVVYHSHLFEHLDRSAARTSSICRWSMPGRPLPRHRNPSSRRSSSNRYAASHSGPAGNAGSGVSPRTWCWATPGDGARPTNGCTTA